MIVAIAERRQGNEWNPASFEAMAAARALGAALGQPVVAAALEDAAQPSQAGALAAHGLDRILVARHASLAAYDPELWVQALAELLSGLPAAEGVQHWVLLPHTYQARDFAPRLATRMGSGLVSDVTAVRAEAGRVIFTRPLFQGKLAAEVTLAPAGFGFATVQAGAFRAEPAPAGAPPAPIIAVDVAPGVSRLSTGPVFQEAHRAVDLTQAGVIVAVGRGIRDPKNLEMVRELAAALGAELAASRPICDAGWLPMDRQVGSSGQTVAPRLYLAVGISGAIQHLVGMKGSRTVVAINQDPDAPIFEVADYGAVGNLFDIVPALIAALRSPPASA